MDGDRSQRADCWGQGSLILHVQKPIKIKILFSNQLGRLWQRTGEGGKTDVKSPLAKWSFSKSKSHGMLL